MDPHEISAKSVLGERAVRYKRNVLAASLIITVLFLTNASLGDASFFGVSLPDTERKDEAAWAVLAAIQLYHMVMLGYYGWIDWQGWQRQIRWTFHFPPLDVVLGLRNDVVVWHADAPSNMRVARIRRNPESVAWSAKPEKGGGSESGNFSRADMKNVRWRLGAFLTIEFGLPFLWGLVSLVLALLKIFGEQAE